MTRADLSDCAKVVLLFVCVSAFCWGLVGLSFIRIGHGRIWPVTSYYLLPNLAAVVGWIALLAAIVFTVILIIGSAKGDK